MECKSGDFLLSHTVPHAISSAPVGLTAVFGMETGVPLPIKSPEKSDLLNLDELQTIIIQFTIIQSISVYKFDYTQILWSSLGTISTGQLNTLPHLHFQPINVVVFHESHGQN